MFALAATIALAAEEPVLVFAGWDYDNKRTKWDIYRMSASGQPEAIVKGPDSEIYPFAFPNERAFGYLVEKSRTERREVFKFDLKTGQSVSTGIVIEANSTCQASPDGRQLACGDSIGKHNQIVVFDLATKERRQISSLNNDCLDPSWSPDGRNLVYWTGGGEDNVGAVQKPRGNHLVVYNFESKQHQLLTKAPKAYDTFPRWSPDGAWITFYRRSGKGRWDIWVMRPDGSGETQLTSGAREDSHPSWSPDSKNVVFQSYRDDGDVNEIYSVEIATKQITRITHTKKIDENTPTWIK